MVRGTRDVAEAVQDCVSLLCVPRAALGLCASGKGLVAGCLTIHDSATGECGRVSVCWRGDAGLPAWYQSGWTCAAVCR